MVLAKSRHNMLIFLLDSIDSTSFPSLNLTTWRIVVYKQLGQTWTPMLETRGHFQKWNSLFQDSTGYSNSNIISFHKIKQHHLYSWGHRVPFNFGEYPSELWMCVLYIHSYHHHVLNLMTGIVYLSKYSPNINVLVATLCSAQKQDLPSNFSTRICKGSHNTSFSYISRNVISHSLIVRYSTKNSKLLSCVM